MRDVHCPFCSAPRMATSERQLGRRCNFLGRPQRRDRDTHPCLTHGFAEPLSYAHEWGWPTPFAEEYERDMRLLATSRRRRGLTSGALLVIVGLVIGWTLRWFFS